MADRITNADVGKAFDAFLRTAERLGFNTQQWALLTRPFELVKKEDLADYARVRESTEFPRTLGGSPREAYNTLVKWTEALHATEVMRSSVAQVADVTPQAAGRTDISGWGGRELDLTHSHRNPQNGDRIMLITTDRGSSLVFFAYNGDYMAQVIEYPNGVAAIKAYRDMSMGMGADDIYGVE